MRRKQVYALGVTALLMSVACGARAQVPAAKSAPAADTVRLPAARAKGSLSLEEALGARRSVRQWAPGSLKLEEVAQLVWAAQGVTSPDGKRTAPSAMGRFPIQLYVVACEVDGLAPGVYRYLPAAHALARLVPEDRRAALAAAARGQASVASAPLVLVLTADPARFGARTDERTDRFMAIEAGAVLQNIQLQATALKLGSVPVGGYQDAALAQALPFGAGERPMIVVPIGHKP